MDTITIYTHVDASIALRDGVAAYGYLPLMLTDECLAELTAEERAEVGRHLYDTTRRDVVIGCSALHLDAARVDWSTVRAAIARDTKAAASKASQAAAEQEAAIVAVLAEPIASWIDASRIEWGQETEPSLRDCPYRHALSETARRDARIVARIAEAKASLAPIYAAWRMTTLDRYLALPTDTLARAPDPHRAIAGDPRVQAHRAAIEASIDKRDAARTAELAATVAARKASEDHARSELRAFAAQIDDLARAVAEDYEVEAAVVDHVAERIEAAVRATIAGRREVLQIVDGSPAYDRASWEERKAPRPGALNARDQIVAAAASVERPACVTINVSRVMRIEIEAEGDRFGEKPEGAKYTGIVVTISSPVTPDRCVIVSAE